MEFIAFPIGHSDTTLTKTLKNITAAFSTVRPYVEHARANMGATDPAMDHNAMTHDLTLFKSVLDSLIDLIHPRLIGIIRSGSA
jgi:hypothetical protein